MLAFKLFLTYIFDSKLISTEDSGVRSIELAADGTEEMVIAVLISNHVRLS